MTSHCAGWPRYRAAAAAKHGGCYDFAPVTVWALFGCHDWDSLMTEPRGHYEPGVFERAQRPSPATELASLVRNWPRAWSQRTRRWRCRAGGGRRNG